MKMLGKAISRIGKNEVVCGSILLQNTWKPKMVWKSMLMLIVIFVIGKCAVSLSQFCIYQTENVYSKYKVAGKKSCTTGNLNTHVKKKHPELIANSEKSEEFVNFIIK